MVPSKDAGTEWREPLRIFRTVLLFKMYGHSSSTGDGGLVYPSRRFTLQNIPMQSNASARASARDRQRATSSRASSASTMKACAVLPVCCAAKAMRTLSSPDSLSFVLPGIVDTPETGDTVAAPTHPRQRERLAEPETLLRPLLFPLFFALLFGRVGGLSPVSDFMHLAIHIRIGAP